MKKILFLGLMLTIIAASASAQTGRKADRFRHHREMKSFRQGDLNRFELKRLHNGERRITSARKRAHRDGRVTPFERRHLSKMRKDQRRDFYRFKHNKSRRVI